MKFQYYDYKKKEWKEEWNTMGADGLHYLPTHVRVTLGLLDERGQEMTFTSAARIHMTEPVDYRPVQGMKRACVWRLLADGTSAPPARPARAAWRCC